ncbi:hypothetical protein [Novosphingobium sp. M1R2S20]|uniref:Uncharacterized protein n=1 Tax=Novosphingobium rhizovicinum TaxID=3228928 RepID=A0ABV3R6V2_9SPHN
MADPAAGSVDENRLSVERHRHMAIRLNRVWLVITHIDQKLPRR